MRAVVFDSYGGPEVLRVDEIPEPHAGPGQIRIKVEAASINPVDYKIRRGYMSGGKELSGPQQIGADGAGVVDEVGDDVTGVAVGDEVLGVGQGVQAEYAVLNAWVAKPEGLGWREAGALGVIGETAARGLTLLGTSDGDTVFVDGASGGVGKIVVQLATVRGAKVIGSASAGKQDVVAGLGAEPVVYGDGLADRVTAIGSRVDGVYDTSGKTPIEQLISLVDSPHDVVTIANFGAADSGVQVTGGGMPGPDPFGSLTEVIDAYGEGKLTVEVNSVLPFDQAGVGHEAAEAGTTKVVLVP